MPLTYLGRIALRKKFSSEQDLLSVSVSHVVLPTVG